MNKIVILTGIPGSGKTTLLNGALEVLKKEGVKYEAVSYGTVMFDIAREMGVVKDRDEMRKLDPATQKDIQKTAGKKIAAMASKTSVIVDTHCTISTPAGYLPGLPEWVLREIMPNMIAISEADPAHIARRRNSDKSRVRDAESAKEIALHQEINRATSAAYCVMTGATTKIIVNEDHKLDAAVAEFVKVLR